MLSGLNQLAISTYTDIGRTRAVRVMSLGGGLWTLVLAEGEGYPRRRLRSGFPLVDKWRDCL